VPPSVIRTTLPCGVPSFCASFFLATRTVMASLPPGARFTVTLDFSPTLDVGAVVAVPMKSER